MSRAGDSNPSETAQPPPNQAAVRAQPSPQQFGSGVVQLPVEGPVLSSVEGALSAQVRRPTAGPDGARRSIVPTAPRPAVDPPESSGRRARFPLEASQPATLPYGRGVRARSALVATRPATPRVTTVERAPRELQASLPSRGLERADHPWCRRAACMRYGHGDCYSVFHV